MDTIIYLAQSEAEGNGGEGKDAYIEHWQTYCCMQGCIQRIYWTLVTLLLDGGVNILHILHILDTGNPIVGWRSEYIAYIAYIGHW